MCANAYPFPPQNPAVYMFPITLSLLTIWLNLLLSFLRGTYKKKQLPFSATHTIAPKYSTSPLIEERLKGGGIEIEPMGVYVCVYVCISVHHSWMIIIGNMLHGIPIHLNLSEVLLCPFPSVYQVPHKPHSFSSMPLSFWLTSPTPRVKSMLCILTLPILLFPNISNPIVPSIWCWEGREG